MLVSALGIVAQFLADLLEVGAPFLMSQFPPLQKRRMAGLNPIRRLLFGHDVVSMDCFFGRGIMVVTVDMVVAFVGSVKGSSYLWRDVSVR